jgi:hypothetical protein
LYKTKHKAPGLIVYLVEENMVIEVLKISTMMALLITPLFFPVKRKSRAIRIPKNYNDTSGARYAINERGYLEEIHHDRLSA